MKNKAFLLVLVIFVLASALSYLAYPTVRAYALQTVYVQSEKAKILGAPAFGAEKVAEAAKGQELQVLEKKGRWYKVLSGDKSGWVAELVVGPTPPLGKVTVFTGEEKDIGQESRRRASQVTSAAAARGLTEEDRKRLGHKDVADYGALQKVEGINITDSELAGFREALR